MITLDKSMKMVYGMVLEGFLIGMDQFMRFNSKMGNQRDGDVPFLPVEILMRGSGKVAVNMDLGRVWIDRELLIKVFILMVKLFIRSLKNFEIFKTYNIL